MSDSPSFCARRYELMSETQRRLQRLAELARAETEALETGDEERIRSLDDEIEHTIGAKERALGALRHHREEHGC